MNLLETRHGVFGMIIWSFLMLSNVIVDVRATTDQQNNYRGWSTWSLQAYKGVGYGIDWANEANVKAQADILSSEFGKFGYNRLNLDWGWGAKDLDEFGRLPFDPKKYPSGIESLRTYLHQKGLKLGLYFLPGIDSRAVHSKVYGTNFTAVDIVKCPGYRMNLPTTTNVTSSCDRPLANAFGTGYALNYSHPGAQAYIDSIVDQFYSWGVSFVKLDGNVPGSSVDLSDKNFRKTDTSSDLIAWRKAVDRLHQDRWLSRGREKIWLTASWALPTSQAKLLRETMNAWRVAQDIEAYGLTMTTFDRVIRNARAAARWTSLDSNRGPGVLDLDSIIIANMTIAECQTMLTIWSLMGSPFYLGDDLKRLPQERKTLLQNLDLLEIQRLSTSNPARLVGYKETQSSTKDIVRIDQKFWDLCEKTRQIKSSLHSSSIDEGVCDPRGKTLMAKKSQIAQASDPQPHEWQHQIWYAEHLEVNQIFVGVINAGDQAATDVAQNITVNLDRIASSWIKASRVISVRDIWNGNRTLQIEVDHTITVHLGVHESALLILKTSR